MICRRAAGSWVWRAAGARQGRNVCGERRYMSSAPGNAAARQCPYKARGAEGQGGPGAAPAPWRSRGRTAAGPRGVHAPTWGRTRRPAWGRLPRTVWGQGPGPRAPVGQVPAYPAHRGAGPGTPSPAWAAPVSPGRAVALRLPGNAGGGSDVTSRAVGPGRRVPVFQGGAGAARIRGTGRDGARGWRGPPPSRR